MHLGRGRNDGRELVMSTEWIREIAADYCDGPDRSKHSADWDSVMRECEKIDASLASLRVQRDEWKHEYEALVITSVREVDEAESERLLERKAQSCEDCCCAKSWEALGITEYTGRSIPEEIARLRKERDDAVKMLTAEYHRHAEVGESLKECADDLESEVDARYLMPDGTLIHPSYERKYNRDMEPVVKARALLGEPKEE